MKTQGFTLIELSLVVAVIGILAAIAIPQFSMLIRKSQEATTKGNLASIRSAVSIYYGDTEGATLTDLQALVIGQKYLSAIPAAYYPTHHSPGNTTGAGDHAAWLASFTETSDWWLFLDPTNNIADSVGANCIHDDAMGRKWSDQ